MRRSYFFSGLILLLTSGMVVTIIAVPVTQGADKIRFGSSFKESPLLSLPFLAAEEGGFWKENQLEVEWIPFTGGPSMAQAMASHSIDMALESMVSTILSVSRGVPEIIVADVAGRQDAYLWVLSGSPIRTAKDLKGTKLGVARFGTLAEANARTVLKALGIEKEVKLVAAGGPMPVLAALKAGAVDGAFVTIFTMAPLKYAGQVREILSVRDYLPRKWSELVINVRRDFLKKNPDVVKRAVAAFIQATDFIKNNPQWAIAKMKSFTGYSDEATRGMYRDLTFYSKDGKIDQEALESVINFLIEYGLMSKERKPPVESLYTREITG